MAVFVGLDWGNSKVSMATWDNKSRRPELISIDGAKFLPADVGFYRDNQRNAVPIYPADESTDGLVFVGLKRKLPSFRDTIAARFIVESVFKKWRGYISDSETHCSVSVPADYSIRECELVRQAGVNAGFASCSHLNEALAAVLACVPALSEDSTKWRLLEAGRTIWVLDCGSVDLTLALIHAVRTGESLNFAFLAGDCLEDLGSSVSEGPNAEALNRQFEESFPNMVDAAFSRIWSNWVGPRPELSKADWVVPVGGGPNLSLAVEALRLRIPEIQLLSRDMESAELVAFGSCVHAAIQGGQVPYRIGVIRRRMVLGLRSDLGSARFISMSRAEDEVPFTFERAFELPKQVAEQEEIEITLAAALPGGDRFGGLVTYVLDRAKIAEAGNSGLLLKGTMDSWEGGNVEVYDLSSGTRLWESIFQLP